MKIHRAGRSFLLLTIFLSAFGCGSSPDSDRAAVEGTVTFDGTPVASGRISFVPDEGVKGVPVEAAITEGRFTLAKAMGPTVGSNTVSISAMKKTGKKTKTIMGEEVDEEIQYIPEKYNQHSELKTEIQSGVNKLDYSLASPSAK